MDETDRERSVRPLTASPSVRPWQEWARPLDFLARTTPPPGLTVEQTAARIEAYAQALGSHYRGRAGALEALGTVVKLGVLDWTEWPPLPDLVKAVDQRLKRTEDRDGDEIYQRLVLTRQREAERDRQRNAAITPAERAAALEWWERRKAQMGAGKGEATDLKARLRTWKGPSVTGASPEYLDLKDESYSGT